MTVGRRRLSFQSFPAGNLNLQFYQVQSSRAFRDWMFDLQPGIHLHEQEALVCCFVQKLDSSGIPIAGGLAQSNRCLAQRQVLVG